MRKPVFRVAARVNFRRRTPSAFEIDRSVFGCFTVLGQTRKRSENVPTCHCEISARGDVSTGALHEDIFDSVPRIDVSRLSCARTTGGIGRHFSHDIFVPGLNSFSFFGCGHRLQHTTIVQTVSRQTNHHLELGSALLYTLVWCSNSPRVPDSGSRFHEMDKNNEIFTFCPQKPKLFADPIFAKYFSVSLPKCAKFIFACSCLFRQRRCHSAAASQAKTGEKPMLKDSGAAGGAVDFSTALQLLKAKELKNKPQG